MDRVDYQNLRFFVETLCADTLNDVDAGRVLADQLLCKFVQAMAASQVKHAHTRRTFATFRRDLKVIPPSWAHREPGTSSRLPTL